MINHYINQKSLINRKKKEENFGSEEQIENSFSIVEKRMSSFLLQIEIRSAGRFKYEKTDPTMPGCEICYDLKIHTHKDEKDEYSLVLNYIKEDKKDSLFIKLKNKNLSGIETRYFSVAEFLDLNFEEYIVESLYRIDIYSQQKNSEKIRRNLLNLYRFFSAK